ncbi:MAG TPA: hypothetical protein VMT12_11715 [Syntrophales bacterium]|nr:hypothetical protein [Syntrophales bacterium]
MAKWQAAYWGEKGVDVYQMIGQMAGEGYAELLYSGPLDGLKPMKGGMQRRTLIVGRSNAIRLRKRYPPMKKDKLRRAVEMEIPTLFPIADCSFHCRIAETYNTHVMLDIWAWQREPVERLRASFPFRYVIPEDIAFLSSPSGIFIYPSGSKVEVIACGEGRFMDAASYPAADFSKADLERFLAGLANGFSEIKEISFYGNTSVDVPSSLISRVKGLQRIDYPPFLNAVAEISLKPFRLKTGIATLYLNRTLLLRFALYTVLAYGLMLFLTLKDYDKALTDLKDKSISIEKEINVLERGGMAQGNPETIKDFDARMKGAVTPLRVLDVLAADLQEESYVKSLVVNNGIVEMTVSARDPLSVIKQLGKSERIGKVSLKGSPMKETSTGIYNCALLLEIRP